MPNLTKSLSAAFGAENVVVISDDEQEAGLSGFELVPENQRNKFYPSLVANNPRTILALENFFYRQMDIAYPDYTGGYYDFVVFSNGAKAPILDMTDDEKVRIIGNGNFYEGMMTRRVASLVVFTLATNRLAHTETSPAARQALIDNWRLLMDVIYDHDFLNGERDEAFGFLD